VISRKPETVENDRMSHERACHKMTYKAGVVWKSVRRGNLSG